MGLKRMNETALRGMVKEMVIEALNENIYKQQWEDEIAMFFDGLKNGQAFIDDNMVAVEYGHDDRDPRYIYYKLGSNHLNDDHFCVQHSRRLTGDEIKKLYRLLDVVYGMDVMNNMPYEEYGDELGY